MRNYSTSAAVSNVCPTPHKHTCANREIDGEPFATWKRHPKSPLTIIQPACALIARITKKPRV